MAKYRRRRTEAAYEDEVVNEMMGGHDVLLDPVGSLGRAGAGRGRNIKGTFTISQRAARQSLGGGGGFSLRPTGKTNAFISVGESFLEELAEDILREAQRLAAQKIKYMTVAGSDRSSYPFRRGTSARRYRDPRSWDIRRLMIPGIRVSNSARSSLFVEGGNGGGEIEAQRGEYMSIPIKQRTAKKIQKSRRQRASLESAELRAAKLRRTGRKQTPALRKRLSRLRGASRRGALPRGGQKVMLVQRGQRWFLMKRRVAGYEGYGILREATMIAVRRANTRLS